MMGALPRPRLLHAPPAIGAVRNFTQDQTIYAEGERAAHFVLVVHGLVRSCSTFSDGRRFIGAFFAGGDIFGFECQATYQSSAEAVCDSTLIFYPARDPVDSSTPPATMPPQVQGSLMLRIAQARDHARLLGRFSAIEKLSAFLLECSQRSKTRDIIRLEMTRQDIADYLGLTVETISRCLAQLRRDGVIEFVSARQLRLLDVATLRAVQV
jgi:CRP/FNR family nitrogen fixation transcriptional regulator